MHNSHRIKPLLVHQIHIKSLYTYQNFLIRRPKNPQTFKFSARREELCFSWDNKKRVQMNLFKALELVRPVLKIDLSKFLLEQDYFGKNKLLCVFKRIFKVKSFSLARHLRNRAKEITIEKSLKYFKDVQHLTYQLSGSYYKLSNRKLNDCDCEYPLKYLRYCSKLRKLLISNGSRCYAFKKSSSRSSAIMKNHAINNLLLERTLPDNLSTKFMNEIISAKLIIKYSHRDDLSLIQELSGLQEINLDFKDPLRKTWPKILPIVFEKGALKKVKLNFNFAVSELDEIFKALHHSKLTYFSLKTLTKGNRILASLNEFLKHMNSLEYLKLDITNQKYFNNTSKLFKEICQQINKLDQLQHLKLAFNARKQILKKQRLSNFLPTLDSVFQKTIKLKAFSVSCNQIDHVGAFPDLIASLQDVSTSLHKLKIDVGHPSRSPESPKIAADFTKTLYNIKVLKLPCLSVNKKKSLNVLVEAVLATKGLEELILGEVDQNIEVPLFLNTVERIFCKRGLRKFHCQATGALQGEIQKKVSSYKEQEYDMQKFIKVNPCLEDVHLSRFDGELWFTPTIQNWAAEKICYRKIF